VATAPDPRRDVASIDDPLADWLTTSEVATLTGLDKVSVRRYVWRGVMPEPLRKGNFLLWRRADIEGWLAERRPTGRPKKS
jgi:predicted DNA-binding transcriptional regulator AlpA